MQRAMFTQFPRNLFLRYATVIMLRYDLLIIFSFNSDFCRFDLSIPIYTRNTTETDCTKYMYIHVQTNRTNPCSFIVELGL